ncbi:MAG: FAD-binding oxidoreductase [Fimbriimonadaceae bacterium]
MRSGGPFRLQGTNSKDFLREGATPAHVLDLTGLPAEVEVAAADQYVTVSSSVNVQELQEHLRPHGLALPLPDPVEVGDLLAGIPRTVGGLVATNLPHALEGRTLTSRDWVLGLEVMRADGTTAKGGGRTVKNVAGYDVAKLFVGSRGTLGIVLSVTFRLFPLGAMPKVTGAFVKSWSGEPVWIQRTLRTDFEQALKRARDLFSYDEGTSTLWAAQVDRFEDDWVQGPRYWRCRNRAQAKLAERAKAIFDPEDKFNPGEVRASLRAEGATRVEGAR